MKQPTVWAVLAGLSLITTVPLSARAQAATQPPVTAFGSGGSGLGVGVAAFLSGFTGVEGVYDQPKWHAEALLGFSSRTPATGGNRPTTTAFGIGARGWYHLHTGVSSDFSLGGGLGLESFSTSSNGPSDTRISLEPGMQARVFLTPNFDLHATAGISLVFGRNENPNQDTTGNTTGISLTGQLLAGLGFTYFFR